MAVSRGRMSARGRGGGFCLEGDVHLLPASHLWTDRHLLKRYLSSSTVANGKNFMCCTLINLKEFPCVRIFDIAHVTLIYQHVINTQFNRIVDYSLTDPKPSELIWYFRCSYDRSRHANLSACDKHTIQPYLPPFTLTSL